MAGTARKKSRLARDASDALQAAKKLGQQSRVHSLVLFLLAFGNDWMFCLLALNLIS